MYGNSIHVSRMFAQLMIPSAKASGAFDDLACARGPFSAGCCSTAVFPRPPLHGLCWCRRARPRRKSLCEPPDARLVSIQGTVELKRAGTDVWTAAMLEEAFCIGDTLRVGAASRAGLALANEFDLAGGSGHHGPAAPRRRGGALAAQSADRGDLFLQPSAARAGGRHAVRQRGRGGHRVPGPGRRGARRGGDARRPGAAAESPGRAARRERPGGGDPRGRRAGADDRGAPARRRGLGAVLSADPRRARRRRRAAPPVAARTAGRDRAGRRQRLRRRACKRSRRCPRRRAMRATIPIGPACS